MLPQPSPQPSNLSSSVTTDVNPVFALKELVARLHREQHKIQDLLSALGFALRSFNNLNQFLELIPLMAVRVADTDSSALILFKPDGQAKLEKLHCQDSDQRKTIRQAIEKVLSNTTNSTTDSKLVSIADNLDNQLRQHLDSEIQLFGTTILVKHTERGRLYVFTNDTDYAWTETRQKLVRLLADQTAVAVENDALTAKLREKERLDRELEIGAEIQLRLLPRQCPNIPGVSLAAVCQPANRVGGDYYDFIPTHHNQRQPGSAAGSTSSSWGVVIGDVMGKGVPAGLIMTMTRGMLRGEVLNGHSPARILQHLNRVMYTDLENSQRFVTLFYSEYDPQTRILSYSNAAHNPPLLWQAASQTMKRLDTSGMLIGLDAHSYYEEEQVQLEPRDTIIYYTDGLTDIANQSGDRFEEENLIYHFRWACQHHLNPQATLDYLFAQVRQFIGSANLTTTDDMTLVVMQLQ